MAQVYLDTFIHKLQASSLYGTLSVQINYNHKMKMREEGCREAHVASEKRW